MRSLGTVLDLACLAVIALCVVIYARKGFLAGFVSFFGKLIALLTAAFIARELGPVLFDTLFRPGLESRLAESVAGDVSSLSGLVSSALGGWSDTIVDAVIGMVGSQVDIAAGNAVATIIEQVIAPLVTLFITAIAFFVLFALLSFVVRLLKKALRLANRVPVLSLVNRIFGGIMGVPVATLYIFIGLCVIWGYSAFSPDAQVGTWLGQSLVARLMAPLNFFAT